MKPYVKPELAQTSNDGMQDQRFRDEVYRIIRSLNIKMHSDIYQTPKDTDNVALFTGGYHKAFVAKAEDVISGVPGTIVDVPVSIDVVTQISNIHFTSTMAVTATGAVVFNNCSFDGVVSIASGGRGHFIGCTFRDKGVVSNTGAPANVYIIGCVRTTTAHTLVTVIAEVIA